MGRIRDVLTRIANRLSPLRPAFDESAWELVDLPFPEGASRPYIDVIRGAPGAVFVLATVSTRTAGEIRLAFCDRGRGFEPIADTPAGALTVSPLGPTDAWFAGKGGALAHHDGTRWQHHPFAGFYYDFLDVFARDGSDIWLAATGARVVHYDGRAFRVDSPPELAGSSTHELWGTASELFVPVNAAGAPTSVARLTAAGWTRESLGEGGATLIHGSGPDNIWVLSREGGGWHHDGATWTRHAIGPGLFWALHVAAPDRAYAVGDAGALASWDGTRWTVTSIGSDRLLSVYRQRDGRLLVGGAQLLRSRVTR